MDPKVKEFFINNKKQKQQAYFVDGDSPNAEVTPPQFVKANKMAIIYWDDDFKRLNVRNVSDRFAQQDKDIKRWREEMKDGGFSGGSKGAVYFASADFKAVIEYLSGKSFKDFLESSEAMLEWKGVSKGLRWTTVRIACMALGCDEPALMEMAEGLTNLALQDMVDSFLTSNGKEAITWADYATSSDGWGILQLLPKHTIVPNKLFQPIPTAILDEPAAIGTPPKTTQGNKKATNKKQQQAAAAAAAAANKRQRPPSLKALEAATDLQDYVDELPQETDHTKRRMKAAATGRRGSSARASRIDSSSGGSSSDRNTSSGSGTNSSEEYKTPTSSNDMDVEGQGILQYEDDEEDEEEAPAARASRGRRGSRAGRTNSNVTCASRGTAGTSRGTTDNSAKRGRPPRKMMPLN